MFNLLHGAKEAIGESLGHSSLPDTMGNIEDIVKNLPEDPEMDKEKLMEALAERTSGWLGGVEKKSDHSGEEGRLERGKGLNNSL